MFSDNSIYAEPDDLPRIDVTQADVNYSSHIAHVEIMCRQFPKSEYEIRRAIQGNELCCVMVSLERKIQAWAAFTLVDNDIFIDSISVKTEEHLGHVVDSLFDTVTWSPTGVEHPLVTIVWPEHETDSWLFKHLVANGWSAVVLVKERYTAYNQKWDGILLTRQF